MSIAFSDFNLPGQVANPANTIAAGLGFNQNVAVQNVQNITIPLNAVPPELIQQFQYIQARWKDRLESERRVLIDSFLQAIMRPLAPPNVIPNGQQAAGAVDTSLRVTAEQTVGAANNQIGHGPLDYLTARPVGAALALRPSLIIEAKRALGNAQANGQWQLAAQMATARQLAGGRRIYTRGILSDGHIWRFYQLNTSVRQQAPVLERSPAYDATPNGGQMADVVRLLWKFVNSVRSAASVWL